jgi:long-chain acyl-CoA synthetase
MCIHELVFQSAEKYPYRTAFWLRGEEGIRPLTYRDLVRRVMDTAAGLTKLGVGLSDRVGIYAANSPEWCIVYLAILAAGAVVVPMDVQLKLLEVRTLTGRAELKALFCSADEYQNLSELSTLVPPHPTIISLHGDVNPDLITLAQLRELGGGAEFSPPAVDPRGLAALIFTSGTSGESKGVMLSHHNIVSDVRACVAHLPIFPEDRFLSVLPLHHMFEATCGFIYPLSVGASVGHAQSLKSAQIGADIRELQATLMCGVPLLYEKMYLRLKRALADSSAFKRLYVGAGLWVGRMARRLFRVQTGKAIFAPLRRKAELGSIRILVSGAAAIDPEISEFFCGLGIDLLQGYGLTETSPVISVNSARANRYASVGRPLPGVDVKILDPDNAGIGEIAVRGEMVMLGYYTGEQATAEVTEDGFFRTGDLGHLDKHGFLYITGRKKNVIVTPAGKNIYPEEIEALLDNSPYILEGAVLPRKRGTGEEPVAVVVPDYEILDGSGGKLSEDKVREIITGEVMSISNSLAEFKRIRRVIVMTEPLPKTSTRKIKKHVVLDMLRKMGEL